MGLCCLGCRKIAGFSLREVMAIAAIGAKGARGGLAPSKGTVLLWGQLCRDRMEDRTKRGLALLGGVYGGRPTRVHREDHLNAQVLFCPGADLKMHCQGRGILVPGGGRTWVSCCPGQLKRMPKPVWRRMLWMIGCTREYCPHCPTKGCRRIRCCARRLFSST